MKGSAPNRLATGSQTCVRQNENPKARRDRSEPSTSTKAMPRTRATTARAATPRPSRNRLPSRATAVRVMPLSEPLERVHLLLDHCCRQGRIAQLAGEALAVGEGPLHEVHHLAAAGRVGRLFVEQDPGE